QGRSRPPLQRADAGDRRLRLVEGHQDQLRRVDARRSGGRAMSPRRSGERSSFGGFSDLEHPGGTSFFRGAEFSKLLLLAAIMVVGWVLVWNYSQSQPEPETAPEPSAAAAPPKVEPDRAPAFESVTDRTPIGLRDMAAY